MAHAVGLEVGCRRERFETERHRREAPLRAARQRRADQLGQHASTVPRVLQPARLSPIGKIDVLFDTLAVKVAEGKRIERVGTQTQLGHASPESFRTIRLGQQLANHRLSQPQPCRQRRAESLPGGHRELRQTTFHLSHRQPRMHVGAITQRQRIERHGVRVLGYGRDRNA